DGSACSPTSTSRSTSATADGNRRAPGAAPDPQLVCIEHRIPLLDAHQSATGDGEPACKRDSVTRSREPVAIHLCGLPGDVGRASHPTLGLAPGGGCQPPGSPRALVRSYRTVSPLPVLRAQPSAVCSLLP